MKNCLVVIDAWQDLSNFEKSFHNYELIHRNFCKFISYVVSIEKSKKTKIFYVSSRKKISDNLKPKKTEIIRDSELLPNNFENYFFCGFHLGQCINQQALNFYEKNKDKSIGIVLNLSCLSPESNYMYLKKSFDSGFSHYYWNYSGFEKID